MLFCHVLSEYVRICQNGSFLSCIYLHLPQIFAFDLPEKLSESLAPGSRLSEGVIFKGCVVSGIPPDIAYDISRCLCYFIASHIVSLYFVYLIVSFHDVEECILFDFKFFFLASGGEGTWWNIALLNETQSPQQLQQVLLEPRCRTKWTNTKDTEKG